MPIQQRRSAEAPLRCHRPIALLALLLTLLAVQAQDGPLTFGRDAKSGAVIFLRNEAAFTPTALAVAANVSSRTPPPPVEANAATPGLATNQVRALTSRGYTDTAPAVDPVAVADQFLARHGQHFGVTNVAAQLAPRQIEVDKLGMSHVRYEQRHGGIPVWGAELIAHVGAHGLVSTVNGRLAKQVQAGTEARVTQATAEQVAEAMFRANYAGLLDVEVKTRGLYILAPVIEDSCGCAKANGGEAGTLVWVVEVISRAAADGNWYFVDAISGHVVKSATMVRAIERRVWDCSPVTDFSDCYLSTAFTFDAISYLLNTTSEVNAYVK